MRFLAISVLLVIAASHPSAQTPLPAVDGFEVVSVKPTQPGRFPPTIVAAGVACTVSSARYTCPLITAERLIMRAMRSADGSALRSSQIVGGPSWLSALQFEVIGQMPGGIPRDEMDRRLPTAYLRVLEERFKFRSHVERRPMPVYALMKVAKDGRLGPQLRPPSTDCVPPPPSSPPAADVSRTRRCSSGSLGNGRIQSGSMTMAGLASFLTSYADRIVIDRTDLQDKFAVDLQWTPLTVNATPGASDPVQSDKPWLGTAVRDQLGLKLEPITEMMDVLVIDRIEMPDPN
jgi:uncharacterized protein (TIGR03435 family)